MDLDLLDHHLDVRTTTGEDRRLTLAPMSVRTFSTEFMGMLTDLDLETPIWPMPVELADAIPFTEDDEHDAYDPEATTAYWRTLGEVQRVFDEFRARFVGKSSPTHLFWGALDFATTRFSGRTAPPASRRCPQLGPARDARGVLARGQQRGLLARP